MRPQQRSGDDLIEFESRAVQGGLEIRQEGTRRPRLVGHAAVFNSASVNLGGFVEMIRSGAFKRSLSDGSDIRAFVDHDPAMIIGRRSVGSLVIEEDAFGLRVEIMPPDTQAGRDVVENIRNGNLDGMSFGFKIPQGGDRWDLEQEPPLRELLTIDLREVSVVALPAYPKTDVALRSLAHHRIYRPSLAMNRARQRQAEQ